MNEPDPTNKPVPDYSQVLLAEREAKARRTHEVFMQWAIDQPDLLSKWMVSYDDLDESAKDAYRVVGTTIWGDGFFRGFSVGLKTAYEMMTKDRENQ